MSPFLDRKRTLKVDDACHQRRPWGTGTEGYQCKAAMLLVIIIMKFDLCNKLEFIRALVANTVHFKLHAPLKWPFYATKNMSSKSTRWNIRRVNASQAKLDTRWGDYELRKYFRNTFPLVYFMQIAASKTQSSIESNSNLFHAPLEAKPNKPDLYCELQMCA